MTTQEPIRNPGNRFNVTVGREDATPIGKITGFSSSLPDDPILLRLRDAEYRPVPASFSATMTAGRCWISPRLREEIAAASGFCTVTRGGVDLGKAALRSRTASRRKEQRKRWLAGRGGKRWRG